MKFQHAICLAYEQEYHGTQKIPSEEAEHTHFGTYTTEGAVSLELADYIRTLGYHAQVQSQRLQRAVHPDVHQCGAGTAWGERTAPDASFRLKGPVDDDHDRRARPV